MTAHPVSIPEWTPLHKRLPKHTLCLTHVIHDGRRRCLAVPPTEALAYLAKLDRFAAEIARIEKRHHELEAARPLPRGKGPKRVKPIIVPSKFHHHRPGSRCLSPIESSEPDWYTCNPDRNARSVGNVNGYVHEHRTKRGRRFLVRHLQGDRHCPATIARKAAEAKAEAARRAAEGEVQPAA
jgi:hypothetical protein